MLWNPTSWRVITCELCGGDPPCTHVCPTAALVFDAAEDETQGIGG